MADTATADTAPADAPGWLEEWLTRLDAAGFHVGMRERLLAHALLARAAVAGALPAEPAEAARLLGPLVCSSPLQQRRYAELLAAWAPASAPDTASARPRPAAAGPGAAASVLRRWSPLIGLLLLLAAVAGWWLTKLGRSNDLPLQPPPIASAASAAASAVAAVASAPVPARNAVRDAIYVPPRAMPFEPAALPGWQRPLRLALGLAALLSALALGWAWWRQRRRALFLKGVQSDEEVEEQVLRERAAAVSPVAPPVSMLRPASRLLRQRMAGVREELDVPRTIRATLEAGGAFVPRWRGLAQTPEYLVLIDSRGPADHLVRYQRALVDALLAHNVALTVYEFEVTPEHGCWRVRPGDATQRFDRSSLTELAGRYAGQRLLVFADPGIALHPTSGAPRDWATQLKRDFPAAAWFSPRPLASWGAAELQVAEQRDLGFLLLPAHHEALEAVAGWFASERAHLQLPPDLPGPWPVMLGDDALAWAIRSSPPPPEALEHLLFELRQYLGAWRFQWLAACAVFPALAWPLTLGLGAALRQAEGEDERGRALALGIAALGPLPWFRYGHLPGWLREALIERLSPENEARCRALIEQRLAAALPAAGGSELVRLALRRAWLQRGKGVARDLVLVDFLQRGERLARLAQRLPEALRRWLFRNGRPAYGLQRAWLALPALFVLVGALAWTPLWQRVLPRDEVMRLAEVDFPLLGAANSVGIASLGISADGLRLLALEKVGDGTSRLHWMTNRGEALAPALEQVPERVRSAAISPLVDRVAAGAGPEVRVWSIRSGTIESSRSFVVSGVTAVAFDSEGLRVALGNEVGAVSGSFSNVGKPALVFATRDVVAVRALAYSADERYLAAIGASGGLSIWAAATGSPAATPPFPVGQGFAAMAFTPSGSQLWVAESRGVLRLWDPDSARWLTDEQPTRPLNATINALAVDPTGVHLAAGWSDGTITVHSADTGAVLARAYAGAAISALAFGPDGSRLLSGDDQGRLKRWGAPRGVPLRVVGCKDDTPEGLTRRWPTLFSGGFDDGRTVVDAIAYTPKAAREAGQLADMKPAEIVHDPGDARQAALARQVLARVEAIPSRALTRWQLREMAGTLAVTVYACRGNERLGPEPVATPASAPASTPADLPLAKLRFEVFQCSPVDADTRAIATRVQQALRRLGAAEVRLSTVGPDVFEKTFRAQDGPYQIRISRGLADEVAASRVLLADAGFVGAQAWRVVNVAQQSRGYVSVVVCATAAATAVAAATSAATAPALAGPPQRVVVVADSALTGGDPPDLSAYAFRLAAVGDTWFSQSTLNPTTSSNLLNELSLAQSALVVAGANQYPRSGVAGEWSAALMRQLFSPTRAPVWDAILASVGLWEIVEGAEDPKQPLFRRVASPAAAEDFIDTAVWAGIAARVRARLSTLISERDRSPSRGAPLVVHTYDYFTPRAAGAFGGLGPWLLPAMQRQGIPAEWQEPVARWLVDRLAAELQGAATSARYPGLVVIDTRRTLQPAPPGSTGAAADWSNELHPTRAGYRKLAARWQGALDSILRERAGTPAVPAAPAAARAK